MVFRGLLVLVVALAVAGPTALVAHMRTPPASLRLGTPVADVPVALRVLAAWDRRRAAAWRRGDHEALAGLYRPGSRTGARDVEALRAYVDRGLRVRGMRTQVLDVSVDRVPAEDVPRPRRLVLEVTDRVVRAVAVGDGVAVRLPVAGPSTRRITLVRWRGDWRVTEVVPLGRHPP